MRYAHALLLGVLSSIVTTGVLATEALSAPQRVALVIGNSKYTTVPPLPNPVNDATDTAQALEKAGFQVKLLLDANKRQMEEAVSNLNKTLHGGGTGLFYFAGHGLQVEGENYLIPVDAEISEETDMKYRAVNANWILDTMQKNQNDLNILILDACRNNPFPVTHRGGPQGLAQMDITKGSFLAYSTAPGRVAEDGKKGDRNSPFTKNLVRFLQEPDVPLEELFKHVRESVLIDTNNRQLPWDSSSVVGAPFYFVRLDGDRPPTPLVTVPVTHPTPPNPTPEDFALPDRGNPTSPQVASRPEPKPSKHELPPEPSVALQKEPPPPSPKSYSVTFDFDATGTDDISELESTLTEAFMNHDFQVLERSSKRPDLVVKVRSQVRIVPTSFQGKVFTTSEAEVSAKVISAHSGTVLLTKKAEARKPFDKTGSEALQAATSELAEKLLSALDERLAEHK